MTEASRAKEIVEIIGPCTRDVNNCEIMRDAMALRNAAPNNSFAQEIRSALAAVACVDCRATYLPDVPVSSPTAPE